MPDYDFSSPRLFVDSPMAAGTLLELDRVQSNYLLNVMRLRSGDTVLVFNGRDGEFSGHVEVADRKACRIILRDQTRQQTAPSQLTYCFAPLKRARLDYMVQKAVEMGAGTLQPVMTRHTQVARVNLERMRANAIEAAEQCGILNVPAIAAPISLQALIASIGKDQVLIFCDEAATPASSARGLADLRGRSLMLLIGPEGGFSDDERAMLMAHDQVRPIYLGPRILRADTAAVAAMAIVQMLAGDWSG